MKFLAFAAAAMMALAAPVFAAGGGGDKHDQHGADGDTLLPDPHIDVKSTFSGSTISAQVYRSFPKPTVKAGGASSADKMIFQAWLRDDGGARVRLWDADTGAWRATADERWTVEGDLFCLSAGSLGIGAPRLCLDTLIWGQVFSASGPKGEYLVKGNWKKGNVAGL